MANPVEPDFQPLVEGDLTPSRFLGATIEIIREAPQPQPPEHILFDFDGTLSLIREGWLDVMVPMMVEILQETRTSESIEALTNCVREFVMELTGKQTIYQMMRLAEEVRIRGGKPQDPLAYKTHYHDLLMTRIVERRERLRQGIAHPNEMLVPGSFALLEGLQQRGASLYLASGTDLQYVREEVDLLGLGRFFGEHVYGAVDDYRSFSKAMVIERILHENQVPGETLAGFGDGYVEIQNVKAVGGQAIAVASDESGRSGRPDPWKRSRLIAAGADLVIPDYQEHDQLIEYLWHRHLSHSPSRS
jgi:phosphoglycolate phosphatase